MKPSHHPSPLTHHAPVPQELARRGITGARHEIPAGMEVHCGQALALLFGVELRARLEAIAERRACASPSNPPSI